MAPPRILRKIVTGALNQCEARQRNRLILNCLARKAYSIAIADRQRAVTRDDLRNEIYQWTGRVDFNLHHRLKMPEDSRINIPDLAQCHGSPEARIGKPREKSRSVHSHLIQTSEMENPQHGFAVAPAKRRIETQWFEPIRTYKDICQGVIPSNGLRVGRVVTIAPTAPE